MPHGPVALPHCLPAPLIAAVLEKPLEKKSGRNYGPPGTRRLIYFIDDMNMPEVDKYGTVAPHTLIRQHMDHGHWWVPGQQPPPCGLNDPLPSKPVLCWHLCHRGARPQLCPARTASCATLPVELSCLFPPARSFLELQGRLWQRNGKTLCW